MNSLYKILISMKTMGVLTMLFAFSIAYATFVENDYGTVGAKALVFNARWFEVLLLFLGVNLLGNIIRYKLYKKEKLPQFIFHLSFLVILVGAAVTRFVSFEGIMHIREGQSSNKIVSSQTYLQIKQQQKRFEKRLLLSPVVDNSFSIILPAGDKELKIELDEFFSHGVNTLKADNTSPSKIILASASNQSNRMQSYLGEGESKDISGLKIDFNVDILGSNDVEIKKADGDKLEFKTHSKITAFGMNSKEKGVLDAEVWHSFKPMVVYQIKGVSLVLKEYIPHAKLTLVEGGNKSKAPSVLKLKITSDNFEKIITLRGRDGAVGQEESFVFDGKRYDLSYGAKYITLPFSIKLNDFQLQRYKGSNSPSSYASEVTLIDEEQGVKEDFNIYMNHILQHRGYRFYQSSYDMDEMGTVLSVNHDYWGSAITYFGYFIMIVGMAWVLVSRNSRYINLSQKIDKLKAVVAFVVLFSIGSGDLRASELTDKINSFDLAHANKFGKLQAQTSNGMIKPINTVAHEVLNKLTRADTFYGLHANQVFLGMLTRPDLWQKIKIIRVSHPVLQKKLGKKGQKLFPFESFFRGSKYLIGEDVSKAMQKAPKDRDKYDKDLIAVDGRVNITYLVYTGALLKIFPFDDDGWRDTLSAVNSIDTTKSMPIKEMATQYFISIDEALSSKDWSKADAKLEVINEYQQKHGKDLLLSQKRVDLEIMYFEYNIFERLFGYYLVIGLVLLFIQIGGIIKGAEYNLPTKIAMELLGVGFVAQTAWLILRWYISGHAPWSDGYESMIYISWATIFAGFIYANKSAIAMSATAILSGIILFVAHLSWMDPQITNLLPVLKSYWLTIHVAVITASYGFLGLGALIGFINLIFYIIVSKANSANLMTKIKELTYINEKALIVGLILLTIGNFLGGVWANESWGRYWGWDPKETWALVTILVYSFITHLRFIPALSSIYAFNLASVVGFSSVIMTYFGVNFYLSGLHSYAKGDPMPIPDFVYITIVIVAIVAVVAKIKSDILKNNA